jgi:hypothetical protein
MAVASGAGDGSLPGFNRNIYLNVFVYKTVTWQRLPEIYG